ncbi:PspA/IM30 family protein [Longimicrobium sp.]|uniref:PspA/IM30 family protein n=1 Tax=Longimicrobium sp. TaxID=2029185 RepID=UPI003B3B28AA
MINDLKNLFSTAWDAFLAELGRRDPADHVAELLSGMRREMVQARAALPLYDDAVRAADAELVRERKALEDAVRRGGLAERIGDAETVRVAAEFAERHRTRVAVLEDKARAARAEQEMRAREVQDMTRRYKEADANRFVLLNDIRRAQSQSRLDDTGEAKAFDDFGRAADKIETEIGYQEALDELDDLASPPPPPPPDRDAEVDARLAEMKRRMGLA